MAISFLSGLKLVTDRSGWEDGCWPCLPFPGSPASGPPTFPTPSHWRTCVSASRALVSVPTPCSPGTLPPASHGPLASHPLGSASKRSRLRPLTRPALGTRHPHQPGFGPQGSITPWVASSKAPAFQPDAHRTVSQAPTSCLACSLPLTLQLQLQPPCCAPGSRLAGGGGAPFPLASPLYITSASSQIPLGSGKGGLFINFFQGK